MFDCSDLFKNFFYCLTLSDNNNERVCLISCTLYFIFKKIFDCAELKLRHRICNFYNIELMWYLLIFWMGLNYYNRNCFLAQTFDLFSINCLQGVQTIYEVDLCKINRKLGLKNNSALNNLNQSKNESQNTNFLLKIPFVI